jgi:hypothetical protein
MHPLGALSLLAAMFCCSVMSNAISDSHDNPPDATAKETPVKKVTKKARLHKIVKIVTLGMLDTVAVMAAAIVAAASL